MKKYLLITLIVSVFVVQAKAQYWQIPFPNANTNPGGLNGDVEAPAPAGWATVLAPDTIPIWSVHKAIPFSFSFNGVNVDSFMVSNSGIVTFDLATSLPAPVFTPLVLNDPSIPDNSVCISGLGGAGANDNVLSKTFGTMPNRQFWIQFNSFGYGDSASGNYNFCYWSIVLEETSNRIYIVDQRSGGYIGINQISAGIKINNSSTYVVAGSPALIPLAGTNNLPADNTYYTFIPGNQPSFDLAMVNITTSPYQVVGNVNITGQIKNRGVTTITSFDINYKIDGGVTVTAPVTGVNILTDSIYSFTHSTPWTAVSGTHSAEVFATNLNGSNPDADPLDDSKSITVNVLTEIVQRVPLFEIFTSSTCPPCNPGNTNYHNIVDVKPPSEFVGIKFQQDFPGTGDPYCTAESDNRRGFYSIGTIPRMEIDGGWDGNAQSFTNALYDQALTIPAEYKLGGTYSASGNSVSAKIHFSPVFAATGAKLYVAVLEGTTSMNIKNNGETQFFHVMKKMLPTEAGTTLSALAPGIWDTLTFNYTFKGDYRLPPTGEAINWINHNIEHSVEEFSDLYVIAWIQGSDKVVYQAANLALTVGIDEVITPFQKAEVFPNPAGDNIHLQLTMQKSENIMSTIVDTEGKVVASKALRLNTGINTVDFPSASLASGIYHLMLFDSKGNSSVHKVTVQH